jgi:hypothetical protein
MLMSLSLSHLPSEENPPLWLARALSFSNRLRDQSERFVRVRGIETEGTGNALPPIGPQDRNRQIVEEGYQLMSAPFSQVEHGSGFNAPGGDAPMPLVNRLRRAVGASIGSEVVKLLLNRLPVEAIA